jgi:putative transposase
VTETNVFQLPSQEVYRSADRGCCARILLSRYADESTDDGRRRLVRHGHLKERKIRTGIGPVAVRCPRVRDRVGEGSERIRFSSAILPPYAPRRSKSLEVLIPILYFKRSPPATSKLVALLGRDAGGLSASTIGRLKEADRRSTPAGVSATSPPNATRRGVCQGDGTPKNAPRRACR